MNKPAAGQKVDFGYIRLQSSILQGAGQLGPEDYAMATFSEIDPGAAGLAEYGVSSGYCSAVDCSNGCAANGGGFGSLSDSSPAQRDAGALSVASGSSIALTQYGGFYAADLSPKGVRYLWSNLPYAVSGTGGANVGAFSVTDTTSELKLSLRIFPVSRSCLAPATFKSNGRAPTPRCRMER